MANNVAFSFTYCGQVMAKTFLADHLFAASSTKGGVERYSDVGVSFGT